MVAKIKDIPQDGREERLQEMPHMQGGARTGEVKKTLKSISKILTLRYYISLYRSDED